VTCTRRIRELEKNSDHGIPESSKKRNDSVGGRLFLSHASEDAETIKELANQLRTAGVDVWLDLDEIKPGDNWMECLESGLRECDSFAVYVGRLGIARWINREVRVALDRNAKDPEFRVIPILGPGADPEALPTFLIQHQWLDLRDGKTEAADIKKLVGAILSRPAEAVSLLAPGEAPFIGLAAFDVDQAHLFFGRDRETEELLERLRVGPFLAVVGDSGSGKSSLIRAGLIPALHSGGYIDGNSMAYTWQVATLRPGGDPFRELANALMDLQPDIEAAEKLNTREACAQRLAEGTEGLGQCIGTLVESGQRTLLVVDQFEEIFTHVAEVKVRERFIETLLEVADVSGDRPVHVVITLRADFYSECFDHPNLPRAIAANQYAVRAIEHEQLVEVIEKPAAMAGVELEPGLVEAILSDLGQGAGNLPLLEHTLLQLWNLRVSEILTHKSYESIGRVQGALEHHAEEVFSRFSGEEQKQARKLLLGLVQPGRETGATRRRERIERILPSGANGESTAIVLRTLVAQRLLTVSTFEGEEEVQIAHEALLRGWHRLNGWLEEDREFLFWRQRASAALGAWEESGRDPGAFLRGGPLVEAQRWFAARADDLTETGRKFIEESVAKAARLWWVKRSAVAAITVLAIVAIGTAVMATLSQRQAEHSLQLATTAVDEMLTKVGSERLRNVPQIEDVRVELLVKARALYEQLTEQNPNNPNLRLQAALAPARVADIDRQLGKHEAAVQGLQNAIAGLENLAGENPGNVKYRYELAKIYDEMGTLTARFATTRNGYEQAASYYGRAIDMQKRLNEEDPKNLEFRLAFAVAHLNRGILRMEKLSDPERAKQDLIQAIDLVEPYSESPGEWREDILQHLARSNNTLANLLAELKDESEAKTRYELAARSFAELNNTHPESREYREELAKTYNNLASHLLSSDNVSNADLLQDAVAFNRKALDLFEGLAEPLPGLRVELANAYHTEALALLRSDKTAEAIERFQTSANTLQAVLRQYPDNTDYLFRYAVALTYLGYYYATAEQPIEAAKIRKLIADTLPRLRADHRRIIEINGRYKVIQETH